MAALQIHCLNSISEDSQVTQQKKQYETQVTQNIQLKFQLLSLKHSLFVCVTALLSCLRASSIHFSFTNII